MTSIAMTAFVVLALVRQRLVFNRTAVKQRYKHPQPKRQNVLDHRAVRGGHMPCLVLITRTAPKPTPLRTSYSGTSSIPVIFVGPGAKSRLLKTGAETCG